MNVNLGFGLRAFVDMAPLYETLVSDKVLNLDQKALDSMRAKINEELTKLDEK